MSISAFERLTCPLDGEPLIRDDNAWRCSSNHSFDIARQGYINLLPVQHKRSKEPGDHKAMVAARQRFLNAGFYQPIAHAVNQAVLAQQATGTICCLDAGCGEGYYLRELAAANSQCSLALMGLDISKHAILEAAKQDKRATWVVGSNAKLPVQSGTLDCVLCLFGFPVYGEFARVLKPGGLLLQVDAGIDHLRELREIIYPELTPDNTPAAQPPAGFTRASSEPLRFTLQLPDSGAIGDLLAMTPHFYRATEAGRAKAAALTELALTIDVQLTSLIRQPT